METARAHRFFPHPAQARPQARLSPLLVLANSYKQGKRCVAGLDWSGAMSRMFASLLSSFGQSV